MSLSRKIPALLLGGLGVLGLVWLGLLARGVSSLATTAFAERQAAQGRDLERALRDAQEVSLARAELLAGWPDLGRWTADGRRDVLLKHLAPVYGVQNRRYGVDQINLFDARGVAVLRAQSPDVAGDTVLNERPLVAAALRTGEPMTGVVVARTGPSVAAVAPLRVDGRCVGLVEIGMDPARLVRRIHETTGAEAAVLFDRSVLDERAPDLTRRLAADQVLGRYQAILATDWEAVSEVLGPSLRGTVREPLAFMADREDGLYSAAVLPLKDHAGEPIGLLVSLQHVEAVRNRAAQLLVPVVAGALAAAILATALVLGVINGLLLRPVRDVADRLRDLADGGDPSPAGDLLRRRDEVGDLARTYERLREKAPEA